MLGRRRARGQRRGIPPTLVLSVRRLCRAAHPPCRCCIHSSELFSANGTVAQQWQRLATVLSVQNAKILAPKHTFGVRVTQGGFTHDACQRDLTLSHNASTGSTNRPGKVMLEALLELPRSLDMGHLVVV